jgi:hypothetical protein
MRKASGFIPTGKLKNKHTDGRHQQLRILTIPPPHTHTLRDGAVLLGIMKELSMRWGLGTCNV